MRKTWLPAPRAGERWRGYAIAVLGAAAAVLLRWGILESVGQVSPFATFYPVTMAAALVGGTGAGLVATVLSAVAADWFFVPPVGLSWPLPPDYAPRLAVFVGVNLGISILCGRFRAAHVRSQLQAAALASAANAMAITDSKGIIQWVNPAFERLTGFRAMEAIGQNPRVLNSGKHDSAFFKQMWQTILAGRVWQGELVNRRNDGSLYTEEMTITPVRDSHGDITHFIAVKQDVTGRKQAEERLLAFNQQRAEDLAAMHRLHEVNTHFARQDDMHSLLESVLDAAIGIVGASKGFVQLVDPASGELGIIAQRGFDSDFVEYFNHIRAGTAACGTALQTRQRVIVEDITLSPIFLAAPQALQLKLAAGMRAIVCTPLLTRTGQLLGVLSTHFATPRRPGERDLQFLDLLAHQAGEFMERTKREESLREHARLNQLRADATEALQQSVPQNELLQKLAALLVERLDAAFTRVWTLDPTGQVLVLQASAGLYTHLDGAHSRLPVGGQLKISRIAQSRQARVNNQVLGDPDVPNQDWVRREGLVAFAGFPLLLEGRLLGVIALFARHPLSAAAIDTLNAVAGVLAQALGRKQAEAEVASLTRRLAAENVNLERQVEARTARLRETVEELEGFSYSIVHDMRAPLRAMESFGALAEEACASCAKPTGLEYFRRMRAASIRMDQLITDALNYSKIVRADLPLAPVELGKLVRGLVEAYPNLHAPGTEIQIELDALLVRGNESALTQVFGNLLGNAVKFVAPGVKPRVRVWSEPGAGINGLMDKWINGQVGPGAVAPHQSNNPTIQQSSDRAPHPSTPVVRIWIEDNGIGIPPAAHEKIFGMFQRMHGSAEYPGTGIGLTIVRKAMERMGGRVGIESEPGAGSKFWIELPRAGREELTEAAGLRRE